jgi:hypothetical protein
MRHLMIVGFSGLLALSTFACASPSDSEDASPASTESAISGSEVNGLAAQFGLGRLELTTRDSNGSVVRSYRNSANPELSSSSITSSRDDAKILSFSYPDPAGDDFTVDGVFLHTAWQFGLKNIKHPVFEEKQTTWSFANGAVLLREPASFACTGSCGEGATPDELREAMAKPKPGKLGSSAGYVTGLIVSDGIDPSFMVDEASVYLAYRYRTRLGKLDPAKSDELRQVFQGGEIVVEDEGNVIQYTVSVKGLGELERCLTSAVSPTPTCQPVR